MMPRSLWSFILAALHAVIFALALPPFDLWPFAFIVLVPLAWLAIRSNTIVHTLVIVFFTQFVMWLWLNDWIIPVTAVGYPFLSMYMSIYPVVFVWLFHRLSAHSTFSRWPMVVLLPIVWVSVEFLRGEIVCDGYPWFHLAHSVIEWITFVQSADLFGTYFISFLVASVSGFIIDALRSRSGQFSRKALVCSASMVVLILSGNYAYGLFRVNQHDVLSPGPTILAIQTSLPQNNKVSWTLEHQVEDFAHFVDLTQTEYQRAMNEGIEIDLIVWPETMLPGFGLETETLSFLKSGNYTSGDVFAEGIRTLAQRLAKPLLVGSLSFTGLTVEDRQWAWDEHFNSAYLIETDRPYQRYDKVVLTPFGETMPYISNWKWLEEKLLSLGAKGMSFDLNRGRTIKRLTFGANGYDLTIATPICFEDTVASLCRKMVYEGGEKQTDVLVNISNDGWFGTSDADRKLHAQIARFRCIENRVEMVRCVNTGLSVSIDSNGKLLGAAHGSGYGVARQEGSLVVPTRFDSRYALYGRIGDAFAWLILGLCAVVVGWTIIKDRAKT